MKLTVYSKTDCPWCSKVKLFLAERAMAYHEVVLDELLDRHALYDRLQLTGKYRTVPQVTLTDNDGEELLVGGWDRLLVSGIESLKVMGLGKDAIEPEGALEIMLRSNAAATTPGFTLLPVDRFALPTIDFWIAQALTELPPDHPKIGSARRRRAEIIAWQEIYGTKTPD